MKEIRARPIAVAALSAAALASSLALASRAEAALLYDQFATSGVAHASSDEPGGNPATELADDFVVPPGQTWTINALNVYDNNSVPTSFKVYIYSNGAGVPGTELTTRPGLPGGDAPPERSILVDPTITLAPGTYWLVVQANDDSWGWVTHTVVAGSSAAWKTAQTPGGPCEGAFMPLATCFGDPPRDAAFRIGGTSQPISGPVLPSGPVVTPAPPAQPTAAKKKCKKKRRAGAAAKKCRRKRG